jgi:hypothetical protein
MQKADKELIKCHAASTLYDYVCLLSVVFASMVFIANKWK